MTNVPILRELLLLTIQEGASDLHLTENSPAIFRVDGRLLSFKPDILTRAQIQEMIYSVLSDTQIAKFEEEFSSSELT